MIFGVMAGQWLRSPRPRRRHAQGLLLAGLVGFALGTILDAQGVCPSIKRLWTPSWTLYSAGIVCWVLAAFVEVVEVRGWRSWTFPLVVVGMNSIVMYIMAQLLKPWTRGTLGRHVGTLLWWLRERTGGPAETDPFAGDWGPLIEASSVLLVFWVACWLLFRARVFVKL
jgi:predicted acyltransferase